MEDGVIGKDREKDTLHPLIYSPNSHNFQGWENLKPGARTPSHLDGRGPFGLSFTAFPGGLADSWIGSEVAKIASWYGVLALQTVTT